MSTLTSLVRQLDIVVCRRSGEVFELVGESADWFTYWLKIDDEALRTAVNLLGRDDFLDFFLTECESHWDSGSGELMESDPFVVPGPNGDMALSASAIVTDGKPLLLIRNLGQSYEQQVKLMQSAREVLLSEERLEEEVSKRTVAIRERESEIAGRLIYAAGYRDEETGAHIRRIGLYAAEIGRQLGWSAYQVDDIASAAPMHDIGKIGIPDAILKKPGRLTPAEYKVMQAHTRIGADILSGSDVPMVQMARDIAGCHHEYFDGTGYPNGLAGDDIPISARIVAIVDVYDALVHQRVYKEAMPEDQAMALMTKLRGRQYDPEIFDLFVSLLPAMRTIRKRVRD